MIQHPELDGPFSVPTAWADQLVDGVAVRVPTAWRGNRWNTTPDFFAEHAVALAPYMVEPPHLARCWAGDDPAGPQETVALAFPDSQTALAVLTGCGAKEPTDAVLLTQS